MLMTLWLVAFLSCSIATFYIINSDGQKTLKSLILKGFASIGFVLLGLFGVVQQSFELSASLFLLGFFFSLVGDIFLATPDWPEMKERKQKIIFIGGFFFLLAHIAYFVAMILMFKFHYVVVIFAIALGIIFFGVNKYFIRLDFGKLNFGVALYSFFVSLVTSEALFSFISIGFSLTNILIAIGFICFYLSDLVLMSVYFGKGDNTNRYYFILSTYYLAQILLAFSLSATLLL